MTRGVLTATFGAAIALVVAGCESSGLSPREVPGRSQSALLFSLYDGAGLAAAGGDAAKPAEPARPPRLPTSLAVAQVGEIAPPGCLVDALRADPVVFARVVTLPAGETAAPSYAFDPAMDSAARADVVARADADAARRSVAALRRMAADAGAEHLLLVGGQVDHVTGGTPLALFDLTIVGAYTVPSRETRARAQASAALVDVRSGRVVQMSSAEARRQMMVPAVSVSAEEPKLLEKLRDDVLAKLGTQVITDVRARVATGAAAHFGPAIDGALINGPRYHTAADPSAPR